MGLESSILRVNVVACSGNREDNRVKMMGTRESSLSILEALSVESRNISAFPSSGSNERYLDAITDLRV